MLDNKDRIALGLILTAIAVGFIEAESTKQLLLFVFIGLTLVAGLACLVWLVWPVRTTQGPDNG